MSDHPTETNDVASTQKNKKKSPPSFWGNVGILFSGFAIIVLIGVIMVASYGLLTLNAKLADYVAHSQRDLNKTQQAIADTQQMTQQVSDQLNNQMQIVAKLQKSQHMNRDDLFIDEAYYLVRIANDSLLIENDVSEAIKLLQTADQLVLKLNDPKLNPVRVALAADIAALQSVPNVDLMGLYARLSVLDDELAKLPAMSTSARDPNQYDLASDSGTLSGWRQYLQNTWQALQHIVVIRKNQPNVLPFIAPDQQPLLLQNLHMELSKAQWGLLHHQQDLYRKSLERVALWIKQYMPDLPLTQQMLASLTELAQIDVHPPVPTLTSSLQAFQSYLNGR
ncbi:MAG: Uroporphyrinogen III methylase [uncultured bacterium]|nr:MAG: Uroporphyrinogen III methylase [uncultured bacterium]